MSSVVFVLQHVARADQDDQDAKLLGVYSPRVAAEEAIQRLVIQPGFDRYPNCFEIDEYELDQDHWTEGFVTL